MSGKAKEYSTSYQNTMFTKLFDYFGGQNHMGAKTDMTAPVVVDFINYERAMMHRESNVMMSMRFYLPQKFHTNTPMPTGRNMFILSDSEKTYATISFGGFATVDDYIFYRDVLIKVLGSEASKYDLVNIMIAAYDPPFKPFNRKNEVWLRKL